MNEQIKINWYRCKVDRQLMRVLMKPSDFRALCQVIPQLTLFLATGALAYFAFRNIHLGNWAWSVPLLLFALFVHGTFSSFLGLIGPVHELCHKTPFRTKGLNEFFLKLYSFISWSDYVGFRTSHAKHHQFTLYHDHDGELVLPCIIDWKCVKFFVYIITCNPVYVFDLMRRCARSARGNEKDWESLGEWMSKVVIPKSNTALRQAHRRWALAVVLGHLALAIFFIATGHWFLIIIFNLGCFYSSWLASLCVFPQHLGLSSNVPDFRICCRTFTCNRFLGFLYWNMQYHVEHHMFPAIPFYNLPRLRKAIEHDLPPAPAGLWATWKELWPIMERQRHDPEYVFVPRLPFNPETSPAGA